MIGQIFDLILFAPIVNALVLILRGLESISVPGALGFSIIILTALIRLAVWPLISTQLKASKKMAELRPHLEHLKAKHKEDKQALAAAQMALYKEHGVNPAGGCVPLIIQGVILYIFYQVIFYLFSGQEGLNRINSLLYLQDWHLTTSPDPNFFGLNLTDKPSDFAKLGIGIISIPLITAALTFLQSKMMVPAKSTALAKKDNKDKGSMEDSMMAMQSQMIYMIPVMIGYFAFTLPIGIALYWNTLTLISILQQYLLSGWGGMDGWIKKFKR